MLVVFGSIHVGYTMHGGATGVLIQVSELIFIGAAALGAVIVANKPKVVIGTSRHSLGLLEPSPFGRAAYAELLLVLYELFYAGPPGRHGWDRGPYRGPREKRAVPQVPEVSEPSPRHEFPCRQSCSPVPSMTTTSPEILELDLDRHHHGARAVPSALAKTRHHARPRHRRGRPGVTITMGYIGGAAEEAGWSVAAALVGTFLRILLAYGIVNPVAQAVEERAAAEDSYMRSSGRPFCRSRGATRRSRRSSSPGAASRRASGRRSTSWNR